MIKYFIEKLLLLTQLPSVTMFERPLYNHIIKNFNFNNFRKDINENYIAFIPKKGKNNIVISVHIDRLGLVYHNNNFIYSNHYGYKIIKKKYKPDLIFGKRFVGEKVIAFNSTGKILSEGMVSNCWISDEKKELFFNIDGIELKKLPDNTPIGYSPISKINKNEIEGQLDNVISVALAYSLLANNINCTILFTTQEEIGRSWIFIKEFLKKYKMKNIFILDTTNIENLANFDITDIVFRVSDDLADYNQSIINKIVSLANKKGLRYYLKTKSPKNSKIKNITEVGRIIKESSNKYSGASIQFPSIKYHSNHETVKINSIKKIYSFVKELFQT